MAEQRSRVSAGSLRGCLVALALLAATGSATTARADNPFTTVATVGEDIITRYELDQYIAIQTHDTNIQSSPEIERQALDRLIDARIVGREARRYRLSAPRREINRFLEASARREGISASALLRSYVEAGVDEESLRSVIRTQILVRRLAQAIFGNQINDEVDPEALKNRVAEYEGSQQTAYHLFQINLGVMDDPVRARNLVDGIQRRVDQGEPFSDIATRLSRDPNAAEGGELGWFPEDQLSGQLRAVVQRMSIGGVSPPLAAPTGDTLIIHVADRNVRTLPGVAPWSFHAEVFLAPTAPGATDSDRAEALARATGAQQQIRTCGLGLPEGLAVERRILEDASAADLPLPQRAAALSLEIEEATTPVLTPAGASFLLLCGRAGGLTERARPQITQELASEINYERLEQLWNAHFSNLRARAIVTRKDP